MSFLNTRHIRDIANSRVNSEDFSDESRKLLGHSLTDIMFDCYFNNLACDMENDFVWSFDRHYGNCYSFNMGTNSSGHAIELKKSLMSGYFYGLQLRMYVNFYENLTEFNGYYRGLGATIRIGNSSYLSDSSKGGLQLARGFLTNIAIDRSFKFILPKPYSNCDIDNGETSMLFEREEFKSDLYKLIEDSSYNYNQQLCLEQCTFKLFFKFNC